MSNLFLNYYACSVSPVSGMQDYDCQDMYIIYSERFCFLLYSESFLK